MIFLIHAFLSRHSFSVDGSLIQTADQARGKVGVVKWACAYGGGEDGSPSEARNAIQEARNYILIVVRQTNSRLSLRKGEGWGEGSATQISLVNSRVSAATGLVHMESLTS